MDQGISVSALGEIGQAPGQGGNQVLAQNLASLEIVENEAAEVHK